MVLFFCLPQQVDAVDFFPQKVDDRSILVVALNTHAKTTEFT